MTSPLDPLNNNREHFVPILQSVPIQIWWIELLPLLSFVNVLLRPTRTNIFKIQATFIKNKFAIEMKMFKAYLVVFLQLYCLPEISHCAIKPSIIVIGAGPAGIAAATKLLEYKFNNILVLEAENRIGGRVNSVRFGEAVIDLGAEWCHGEKDNVVYDLVKDLKILGHTVTPKTLYHSSKRDLDPKFAEELVSLMEEIYVPDGHRDEEEGQTVGNYCIKKFNFTIYEKYRNDEEKLKIARTSIDLFEHLVLSSEGAFSWFDPSAENDYKDCEGDLNLHWNGLGYRTALDVLMKKFPDPSKQLPFDQTVLLRKEVTRVLWNVSSSRNGITVECSDNTSYEADHVIFTPSIGVLKERHSTMFVPRLPISKQMAIEQIGFGAVMKIAMRFKEKWWTERNFTGFHFVWSDDDRSTVMKEFPEGPVKDGRSWLMDLFSIVPVEHNPNVLIAWLTGDMIPAIERMSHETLIDGVVFLMNKFLSHHYNISEPEEIIRTSWYSNPHFRGSYSFQTVNARKNGVTAEIELAKPLRNLNGLPILHFAGEASHPYYYSTVHGAIETGHREAHRIINLYV